MHGIGRPVRWFPAALLAATLLLLGGAATQGATDAVVRPAFPPVSEVGTALVLLGLALMVAEAFLPSFGVVGVTGIAALSVGLLLIFDTPMPDLGLPWPAIVAIAVAALAVLLFAFLLIWRAYRRPVVTGEPALIERTGHVVSWHGNHGQVHVHGENWRAQSDTHLKAGQTVRVVARDELVLIVAPLLSSSPQR
jgi:membrane-bound serine protease (ClpP class)